MSAYFEDVQEGDEIADFAPLDKVTRTHFVRYAGASGDFNPMHHDDTIATKVGYPSVFGHGMFTAGVLSGRVANWAGGPQNLRKFGVQFKGQLYPDRALTFTGKITRKYKEGDENRVDADLQVVDDQGTVIVNGSCTAVLPSRG
jgi:3-hydroxybutyryl-CoA dehydratase